MISYLRMCLPSPAGTPGVHQTRFKCVVNTPLRFLQLWCTAQPWLVCSVFENGEWTGRYVWSRVYFLRLSRAKAAVLLQRLDEAQPARVIEVSEQTEHLVP